VYFTGVWFRSVRWRILLSPFADVPSTRLFQVVLIGFAVNNVLPLRLGELVRTFLLRQTDGVPIASSLATILIERFLDLFALCGLMTIVLLLVPLDGVILALAGTAATITAAGIVGLLLVTLTPRAALDRLFALAVGLADRIHPRLGGLGRSVIDGLRILEDGRAVLRIVPLSVLCWMCELGLYVCLMFALGFNSGLLSLAAGMVIANLLTILPSAPGYVGTFDFFLQRTLVDSFGVADTTAGAYTILTHTVLLVPVVVAGLILLSFENLSLSGLTHGRVQSRSQTVEAAAQTSRNATERG